MLKKLFPLFALMLLLLFPTAQAEDFTPYVPGSTTQELFSQAYAQGDMVLTDMYYSLKTNENASAVFGEDAAILSALGEALENAVFTVGLGKTEEGVRALLAAGYASGDEQAGLDLLVELTRDGVAIMSGAIPNERFTAKWETLLALAGAGETEIAQILSLRDADWGSVLAELTAHSAALLNAAAQIVAPYSDTIFAHLAALPMEVHTDVPAEGSFPAAATEIGITITQKALGELIIALADQLEQDTTLCAILDAALAQSGEDITTAQLCQSIREFSASMTDETMPLHLFMGMDENENFIYLHAVREYASGGAVVFNIVSTPYAEDESLTVSTVDLLTFNADNAATDGISLALLTSDVHSEDTVLQLYVDFIADGESLLGTELYLASGPIVSEEGLRGVGGQYAMAFAAQDGESLLSASVSADVVQSETAAGGEESAVVGAVEITMDDQLIPMAFEAYSLTETGEDGPTASLSSFYSAPALGVEEYMEGYSVYTAQYSLDLNAVTDLALETASQEELDALGQRVMTALQETMTQLLDLLPPALTESLEMSDASSF